MESVRLDVLVTRDNAPVTGLTVADFEVRDNGVLQAIDLLASEAVPLSVIVALDTSGSLSDDRAARLRAAVRTLLGRLKERESAGLVSFSHVITQLQAPTTDLRLVQDAVERLQPGGYTALVDASYAALSLAEQAEGRGVLVIFSDGLDTASWQTPKSVLDASRRFETVVYAVSVAREGRRPDFLHDLTRQTGGQLLEVRGTGNLEEAFGRILDEVRQRYVLSFTPSDTRTAGWHRLEVRVKRSGVAVRARSGYVR